jgi:RNB domain
MNMNIFKINVDDRNYSSWTVYNACTLEPINMPNLDPIKEKLFSNDVFTFSENTTTTTVQIVHSSTRINENIPAVLILDGNKTYGREKKNSISGQSLTLKSKNAITGRLLYKCIPDDTRMPAFLVPYEIKDLGFSKVLTNLYVTIKFVNWNGDHPIGSLNQNIGPVNILDNFYEYQLYCKSLNASIQKFNKETNRLLKEKNVSHDIFIESVFKKNKSIEDRTGNDWSIFTIDPATSSDFDDGFSVKKLNETQTLLSIYIANVTIWMDSLNLWSSFSRRISTIYLPDRKRPMLPTILSDCLCSLQQGVNRFAFTMDIVIDNETSNIVSTVYKNCMIRVFKNYAYESKELLQNADYHNLLDLCKGLTSKYTYLNTVRNSHEVVCYLMILMNYHCAQELLKSGSGVFRSTIVKKVVNVPNGLPDDVGHFIKIWNSASGQYINMENLPANDKDHLLQHQLLDVDAYIHITSPIRRLVDLLNIINFQRKFNMCKLSEDAMQFYDKWLNELDYINVTMRAIRKVQNDCNLLAMCNNDPKILEKEYDGYCFDKLVRNDGLYQFIVYLPEIKMASRITMRDNLSEYEMRKYKLYLFSDEEKFKRKIRLQMV